ncbi:MAG: hypothetical protein EOP88_07030 [Verrucomicrobiaceae bacterium]|nr:MAG: hypothetical protein EOP88_07030 [Verrucomicrobiaceae bacterium]
MKTQDIRRGITSRHYRAEGSSPDLGNLSRLRNPEAPAVVERRSRRRARSHQPEKNSAVNWLVLVGTGTLAVITATVFLWLLPRMESAEEQTAFNSKMEDRNIRIASKFPSPSREESLELVKRALATRDPAEVSRLFRTCESTPAEIIHFLEETSRLEGEVENWEWMSSLDKDGLLIEGVIVSSKGEEKPEVRLALLTPDDAGVWKLDFDAYARLVEPGWQELLGPGSEQAVVRVTVSRGVYYNGPFSDDKQWVSYGIASLDVNEKLCGYCRVGSAEAEAMAKLFKHEEKVSRATVEIRRVPGTNPKQFEIVRVLGGEWVVASNR